MRTRKRVRTFLLNRFVFGMWVSPLRIHIKAINEAFIAFLLFGLEKLQLIKIQAPGFELIFNLSKNISGNENTIPIIFPRI